MDWCLSARAGEGKVGLPTSYSEDREYFGDLLTHTKGKRAPKAVTWPRGVQAFLSLLTSRYTWYSCLCYCYSLLSIGLAQKQRASRSDHFVPLAVLLKRFWTSTVHLFCSPEPNNNSYQWRIFPSMLNKLARFFMAFSEEEICHYSIKPCLPFFNLSFSRQQSGSSCIFWKKSITLPPVFLAYFSCMKIPPGKVWEFSFSFHVTYSKWLCLVFFNFGFFTLSYSYSTHLLLHLLWCTYVFPYLKQVE